MQFCDMLNKIRNDFLKHNFETYRFLKQQIMISFSGTMKMYICYCPLRDLNWNKNIDWLIIPTYMYIIYTSGEIDDEKHFLISCSTCPEIRTEMFGRINNISVKIWNMSSCYCSITECTKRQCKGMLKWIKKKFRSNPVICVFL
jgi:hypothetical protein